jgi:hypothetical protein
MTMSEAGKRGGFLIKRWCVSVDGYGAGYYDTTSRGKALAQAWRSDAFNAVSFGRFLRMARCWRSDMVPCRWGERITVNGKPAFFISNDRASVKFVHAGEDVVMSSHPYDVLPVEYRPDNYRDRDHAD